MCDSQWAQVIDNRPLSMLGEEISCSSARFVGLKNPREQRERGREKRQREITERLRSRNRAGRTDRLTEETGTEEEAE